MLRRDVISSFLHACLICAFMVFISCASQETIKGGKGDSGDDFGLEADDSASNDADSDEVLELLEDDPGSKSAKKDETDASDDMSELESELSGMDGDDEKIAGVDDKESTKEEPLEDDVPAGKDDEELADLLEGGGEAVGNDELPPPSNNDDGAPPPKSRGSRNASLGMGRDLDIVSRTPKIPTAGFERGGTTLNRFYVARQGDSWSSVSELVYGSGGRSKELAKWNGGGLTPGKVVYYNSPGQPTDSSMQSFYQERGIAPQPYVVKKGDWLSTIAKELYGNYGSWRELAVVNGIQQPDKIEPGQQLSVYPSDLRGYSGGGSYAQAPPAQAQAAAEEEPPPPPPQAEAPPAIPPPAMDSPSIPPPVPPALKPAKAPKKGFSIARILKQELFPIAIGGIILLLALSLLIVNKRKKAGAAGEDFADDGFATRPKARR